MGDEPNYQRGGSLNERGSGMLGYSLEHILRWGALRLGPRKTSAIFALFLLWGAPSCSRGKTELRIAIVSIVEIAPIAELRAGFKEEFLSSSFARTRTVHFEELNAQGDSALVNQIADKLAANRPRLAFVLGTPAAQAIQGRMPDLLVVQGAVTDPVAAGLAKDWSGSGREYVATSDLPPIGTQVRLILQLSPMTRRLGVLYNPSESNSVSVVSRLREEIKKHGEMSLVERPVSSTSDVALVTQSLIGRVDAIYVPPDNTVYAALAVVGRFSTEAKIPFYASVDSALQSGALASLSLDFRQLGRESAQLAIAVLEGANPATLPIRVNEKPRIVISRTTAGRLGVDLSRVSELLPNAEVK